MGCVKAPAKLNGRSAGWWKRVAVFTGLLEVLLVTFYCVFFCSVCSACFSDTGTSFQLNCCCSSTNYNSLISKEWAISTTTTISLVFNSDFERNPSQSRDLNQIENVWSVLGMKVQEANQILFRGRNCSSRHLYSGSNCLRVVGWDKRGRERSRQE